MSFTVLREIEICPLRWSLRRAAYAEVWSDVGYPGAPRLGALAGQVVHGALERIIQEVQRLSDHAPEVESCAPTREVVVDGVAAVVSALRTLGGITMVLENVLASVVRPLYANPRAESRLAEYEQELRRQLPLLRQRVQQLLGQVDVSNISKARAADGTDGTADRSGVSRSASEQNRANADSALGPGLYAEVSLSNPTLDWYGKADLIRIDGEICEIIDFKTGAVKADHELQLRIYALLWHRDMRRNPSARRATHLTLVYPSGRVSIAAPTTEELDDLANEVAERSAAAHAAIASTPPEARPSRAACEWCDVRQMCERYWESETRATIDERPSDATAVDAIENPPGPVNGRAEAADVELRILGIQGEWSWNAMVTAVGALSVGLIPGTRVLVRARPRDIFFSRLLRAGNRVRIIGAQHLAPSEESAGRPVIALGRSTEAFILLAGGQMG